MNFIVCYQHYTNTACKIHAPYEKKIPILNKTRAITKSTLKWTLGESEICPTNQAVYLGIIRSEMKENEIDIEDRISLARRTMYTLMNTVFSDNISTPYSSFGMTYASYIFIAAEGLIPLEPWGLCS
jgi:hypothetical protein